MTMTEDTSGMTVDLIILVIAHGTDTTLGAWLVGTACLPTQLLKTVCCVNVKRK